MCLCIRNRRQKEWRLQDEQFLREAAVVYAICIAEFAMCQMWTQRGVRCRFASLQHHSSIEGAWQHRRHHARRRLPRLCLLSSFLKMPFTSYFIPSPAVERTSTLRRGGNPNEPILTIITKPITYVHASIPYKPEHWDEVMSLYRSLCNQLIILSP